MPTSARPRVPRVSVIKVAQGCEISDAFHEIQEGSGAFGKLDMDEQGVFAQLRLIMDRAEAHVVFADVFELDALLFLGWCGWCQIFVREAAIPNTGYCVSPPNLAVLRPPAWWPGAWRRYLRHLARLEAMEMRT